MAFGGYYVWHTHSSKQTTTSSTTTASSTKPSTSTSINLYAGWNSFTLPKEKLSFRYPSSWSVENNLTTNTDDGVKFTSKTDSSFEILIGAGHGISSIQNYDGNCVQKADQVTFDGQSAYLDLVGFANINTAPPSCTPASSTIQRVLLSKNSSTANTTDFFLTKNIAQPTAQYQSSSIIVLIDYNGPNGSNTSSNLSFSQIENNADYKLAKHVIDSMSY